MKTYTILEALEAIKTELPINLDALKSISYINENKCMFKLVFNDGCIYFVNLDDFSYYRL